LRSKNIQHKLVLPWQNMQHQLVIRIAMRCSTPLSIVCCLFLLAKAHAHDTWLVGSSTHNNQAQIALTTGSEFPKLGEANNPSRIQRSVLLANESSSSLLVQASTRKALLLSGALPKPGVYVAIAQTKPNAIELDAKSVREYMRELGSSPEHSQRYQTQGRWRELYAKNAKMILRTDAKANAAWALKPMNLPYEFVPTTDPTQLKDGDVLKVCAYAEGKRVPKAYIGMVGANGKASFKRANSAGCASFSLKQASNYLVRGVHIQPTDLPDLEWVSHFAALTVFDSSEAVVKRN
jgi:uncharacterized GH25 family protein